MHEEIDVPKSAVYLRTGVYDPASKKVGSLEIPLSEVKASLTPAMATPTAAQALLQPANIRGQFMSRVVPSLSTLAVLPANSEPSNPSAIVPADSADANGRGLPSALTATGIVELESTRLELDSAIRSYCEARAGANKYSSALANVCEFALSSREELPDIICHREMRRSKRDLITSEVRYSHGQEYYDDIQINRRPVDIGTVESSGNWSDGEFATILQGVFYPRSNAAFQFKKEEVLRSNRALVFEFHVDQRNNKSYRLRSGHSPEGTLAWFPDYHGRLWLDKKTFRLMRLERETDHMRKYPITFMETRIDYAYVPLGDGSSFVLPTNSDVRICSASQSDKCSHNIIKFSNWHKFRAKTRILMDATK